MDDASLEERLGAAVRAKRIDIGLTRKELAATANVSAGALAHLENGQGATVRTLVRALVALDATGWLDQLHTPSPAFSPLAVAAQARAAARTQARAKVRRAPRASRASRAS
ncbi:MAG: helix-turn-helix domain-containing protein [Candidatus Nanopelagicales bacterium]|jgi:transcriptional regulator with XRE-family HTH domain|nr:helix-turn-helix domain-containing protein [Candidatus Nanopelagicales bacterium]MDP4907525.1 helix-turn-helix domain-containing protein [Candidatus Nanopelagicales bacterium]MDP5094405.1 helix-turn-helix domain-containing protein [Candidatus Nanopelagicales bacterium]